MDKNDIECRIKNNPEKYLNGKISIETMNSFLAGYETYYYLIREKDNNYKKNSLACDKNHKWHVHIQKKYGVYPLNMNGTKVIDFFSESEEEGFYNYFKEREEFENSYVEDLTEINKLTKEELEENFQKLSNKQMEDDLRDLSVYMGHIKKRPALYLGEKSLKKLGSFLEGYVTCRNEFDSEKYTYIEEFEEFVKKKYEKYLTKLKTQKSYVDIIRFMSMSEESALELFFELFEEFSKTRGKG